MVGFLEGTECVARTKVANGNSCACRVNVTSTLAEIGESHSVNNYLGTETHVQNNGERRDCRS